MRSQSTTMKTAVLLRFVLLLWLCLTLFCVGLALTGCGIMGKRIYGVWLDPSARAQITSVALVVAYESKDGKGGVKARYSSEGSGSLSYQPQVSLLAKAARDGAERRIRETGSFTIISLLGDTVQLPPPASQKNISPLPRQTLESLGGTGVDGYLLYWAEIYEGLLGGGSGRFWSVLYSNEGRPLWCRNIGFQQPQQQRTYVGGGVSVGLSLSDKTIADMNGYAMARALEWSMGKKK